jgi:hypothetical protein
MQELIKIRNLKERDCATVAERCRVLPPLSSLRVLLGYAVTTGSRNKRKDHVTSVTSRATIHNAAFSACQIPVLIRETEASAVQLLVRSSSVRSSTQLVTSELVTRQEARK